ncbi:MAG: hypothetical protein H6797_04495 [Candidatus Nomurabacteria bacterium]|nr:MAG: hypothetical protein H6797_04495 [Candidatus Nomurabacteria bacterium]
MLSIMKNAASYELSVHSFTHIHKNLAELSLATIPLSVPTRDENLLINSGEIYNPRRIVVETERAGRDFVVRREDSQPIQVVEADDRRETCGQELFYEPLDYLTLSSNEKFVWHVNTTEGNVRDTDMLREFVGILSTFALTKQLRIKND